MKSSKLLILFFATALFGATGCSDDGPTNTGPTIEPPSAAEFNALQQSALDSRTETTQFAAEDGISFTSENGVDLNILAGCLTSNGQPVSGQVNLEYVEIFDRADMLATNKPTMGLMPNGDKKMLVSGGSFHTTFTQNGDSLQTNCSLQLVIPGNLTGGVDTDMTLWKGTTDSNGNLTWEDAKDDGAENGERNAVFFEAERYYVNFDGFSATNVDRLFTDPRPKTTVQVRPPEGYDAANSAVYLSYDGEGNALANLDTFNEETGIFSEHYGQVPVGLEMHVIFVTEDEGQWRYATKGVTVADNDLYTFTIEETQLGTEQDMLDAMNDLP